MSGVVRINGYTCYHDIYELMKQTGDVDQCGGVWSPRSDTKYVYAYRQVLCGDTIIYYYTAHKSVEAMLAMVAAEKDSTKRNFGEVVMRGRLYCVVEPTQSEYADPLATMRRTIRKYVGDQYSVSETMYRIDEHSPQYYIFNVTNGKTHLYWDVEHMRKLVGAICYHVDETTGQFGGIYREIGEGSLASTIRLDVYSPMQHITLPGCVDLEKPVNSCVTLSGYSTFPCVSFTDGCTWQRGTFVGEVPHYENKLQVCETGVFDRIMDENDIVELSPAPWLGEYRARMPGMCECPVIIKHSSRDIKLIRSCVHYDYVKVLYVFPLIDAPQLEGPLAEIFDDYTNMDLNSARYTMAIRALKRVLVYDSESKKIAVKRRNKSGNIYWEYWHDKKFFETYDRYVKNHTGKLVLLKEIIKKQASEFKSRIVWIPYSWIHKPDDFEQYSSCVNQYPDPRKPQKYFSQTDCIAFTQYITRLFRGNEEISRKFILFIAMIVQKPFLKKRIHIIFRNANVYQLETMFKEILHTDVVQVLHTKLIKDTIPSILCIVEGYECIGTASKNVDKFYADKLYDRETPFMTVVMSMYNGDGNPILQNNTHDIILDAEFIRDEVPMNGVYDMLMSVDESEYDGIINLLAESSPTPKATPMIIPQNSVMQYINEVRQNIRPDIKSNIAYNTDKVYQDYKQYSLTMNFVPEQKRIFGRIVKANRVIHNRVREGSRLVYKYTILHADMPFD